MRTRPAIEGEIAETEGRRDHAHEHQQLGNRQNAHHQFKGCGQFHANDIERHEYDIGPDGGVFGVKARVLNVEIGTNGHGDGRWREDEFDQRRHAGDQPAFFSEGAAAVGKRPARVRNGGGQFGKTEDEAGVHGRDHQGCYQKAQRTRHAPAVAPAEVFAGDHQPDRNPP